MFLPTPSHPCPSWLASQPSASPPWGRCCSVQWPRPEIQPRAARGSSASPGQYQWTAWSAEAKTETMRLHDLSQTSLSFQLVPVQSQLSVASPARRPWTWWLTRVQSWARWCRSPSTVTLGHPHGSSEWSRRWCTCCCCGRREPGGEGQAWISSSPHYDSATFFCNPGTKGRFFIYPEICQGFNPFQITSTIGKQASFLFC